MAHILIVEDDPAIGNLLVRAVARLGHTSTLIENGAIALNHLDTLAVALLITDLQIPGLSGVALLEHVRDRQHRPRTVVVSGHMEELNVATELADRVFAKPFLVREVQAAVAELLA